MKPEKLILKFTCKTIESRRMKVLQRKRWKEKLAILGFKANYKAK